MSGNMPISAIGKENKSKAIEIIKLRLQNNNNTNAKNAEKASSTFYKYPPLLNFGPKAGAPVETGGSGV